jgi:DNA-binding NtrC family response regulator
VRELRNLVERMVILSGDAITLEDVPEEARMSRELRERLRGGAETDVLDEDDALETAPVARKPGSRPTLREHRDAAERQYVLETLREVDWNISRAATILGVERTNLHKKMRALAIRRDGEG